MAGDNHDVSYANCHEVRNRFFKNHARTQANVPLGHLRAQLLHAYAHACGEYDRAWNYGINHIIFYHCTRLTTYSV